MNPIQVDLIVLGLNEIDDKKFLEDKEEFLYSNTTYQFYLDYDGNNYGINCKNLSWLLKEVIRTDVSLPKNKYSYYIYNNRKEKFIYINTSKSRRLRNNFYPIALQEYIYILDKNYLVIKVQLQIKYYDYKENWNLCKIDTAIQTIKSEFIQIEDIQKENVRLKKIGAELHQVAEQNGIQLTNLQKIDIALLYSHPLINDENDVADKPVSYKQEFDGLTDIKHRANKKIKYLITQASLNNLKFVLKSDPQIIHIASHGVYNEDFNNSYLQFENQQKSNNAYTYQLDQIINQNCLSNLKLIFLNSCHSNEIAKKINQYTSTIAVTKKETIADEIALEFALEFYKNLLLKQSHLENSFDQAKKALLQQYSKNKTNTDEINKFKFILNNEKEELDLQPREDRAAKSTRQITLHLTEEFKGYEILIAKLYQGLHNQFYSLNSLVPKKYKQIIQIISKNYYQDEENILQQVTKGYQYFISREPPFYVSMHKQFPKNIKNINISEIDECVGQYESFCIFRVTSESFNEKFNKINEIASNNICIIITSEKISQDYDGISFFKLELDQLQ